MTPNPSPVTGGVTLLPCPFCGGDALFEQDRSDGPRTLRWSAGCREETCMGYMGPSFPRRKDAAEAWNRRSDTAAFEVVGKLCRVPNIATDRHVVAWSRSVYEGMELYAKL